MKHTYYVRKDGAEEPEEYTIERLDENLLKITRPDGTDINIDYRRFNNFISMMTPDSRSVDIHVAAEKDDYYRVTSPDETYRYQILNERKMLMAQVTGGGHKAGGPQLLCPMAGKVVLVKVNEGDLVEEGEVVVVVEAMKMENDLKAHLTGKITKVVATPGDTVDIGDVLVEITTEEGE